MDLRHRNAFPILVFLRFWQENGPVLNNSPSIQNEKILHKEYLPPLVEGLDHGVIWIALKNKDSAQEKKAFLLNSIKDILQKIKNQMSVAILHTRLGDDKELAENIKEIKEEDFLGPYDDYHFNGKEAEVIISVNSGYLQIQTMARARRLLILVTYGDNWKEDSEYVKAMVKVMNSAVEQKLVQKISK